MGVAVAEGGERIELHVVGERLLEIERAGVDLLLARSIAEAPLLAVGRQVARVGDVVLAGRRVEQRVVELRLGGVDRAVGGLVGFHVQAEVGEAALRQADAEVRRHVAGGAVAGIVLAAGGVDHPAGRARLQDDVDHPGDGVRAVLGRGAVTQHLDVVDGAHGDQVEVDRHAAVAHHGQVVDQRGVVTALAVDQEQHLVAVQAAEGHGVHRPGGPAAVDGRQIEGGHQLVQHLLEARLAGADQFLALHHVDRRGTVDDGAGPAPHAGDDDLIHRARLHRGCVSDRRADREGRIGHGRRGGGPGRRKGGGGHQQQAAKTN